MKNEMATLAISVAYISPFQMELWSGHCAAFAASGVIAGVANDAVVVVAALRFGVPYRHDPWPRGRTSTNGIYLCRAVRAGGQRTTPINRG